MFTTNSDPVEALVQRFGIRGRARSAASGMGWLGALSPVRLAVDEAIVRQVRAHAPPEGLQSMLAALQLEVEKFLGCGGKRLRAVALLSAYTAWAREDADADELAIDAAAAIEVLHGFMLAHDDIVDRRAWRRGEPTLHVRLAATAAGDRSSPLGGDLALIAGDILVAQANRHMMLAPWPEAARGGILEDWCSMVIDTGYGQWADTLNDSASLLRLTSPPPKAWLGT